MTLRKFFFITLFFSNVAYSQIPNYVPQNGLVGWWPFNGNANDESGNANNGSVNNATLTQDRFGSANSAYDFDANAQIVCPQNNIPTQIFSLSVWINQDNSFGNMQYVCLGSPSSTTWGAISSNNNLHVDYGAGCLVGNGGPVVNSASMPVASWIHLIFVCSGVGGNTQIYKNGVFVGQVQNSTIIGNCSSQNLYFGVDIFSISEFIDGKLDDIGIWNRTLTLQEISNLYNGCQLSINTQPNSQTININNSAQFVVASSDPNATYQWQTDLGVGYQNLNNVGQYNGVSNDTLSISNVTQNNNNQTFRCLISTGSCSEISDTAILTVSNNVGIQDNSQDNLYSIYPNPTNYVLKINAEKVLIGENYILEDNLGKTILRGKITAETTSVDVNQLTEGVYFLKIGKNLQQVTKVIKAK